jgi:16S rRNA (guanine527-N7)-methyltransferase
VRDPRLAGWLSALVSAPGLTAVSDAEEAWRFHVEDALVALPHLGDGPFVDVGSGGGSPGIPLAAAVPGAEVVLLEASEKKCAFLRAAAAAFPNASVVCARAEEHAAGAGRDAYGTVLARALAPPRVAAEWCLPLAAPGGRVVLYTGEPDAERVAAVSALLGGGPPAVVRDERFERRHLVVLEKLGPTPAGFPRRSGLARKRPLA